MKIQTMGAKILVSPVEMKNHKTEQGLEIIQTEICEGVIVEVSNDLKHLYSIDDHVIYTEGSGLSQYYKGKTCVWLDGRSYPEGHIWGIVTEDKKD
jgi:hypothetical protein